MQTDSILFSGLFDLPWWGLVAVTLALTHVTIAGVTIFLHRHQAHRALDLHPALSRFFRWRIDDQLDVIFARGQSAHGVLVKVAIDGPATDAEFAIRALVSDNYLAPAMLLDAVQSCSLMTLAGCTDVPQTNEAPARSPPGWLGQVGTRNHVGKLAGRHVCGEYVNLPV